MESKTSAWQGIGTIFTMLLEDSRRRAVKFVAKTKIEEKIEEYDGN